MPVQAWHCEKCGSRYEQREKALECEGEHRDPKTFIVTHANYRAVDSLYGAGRSFARIVPESVRIKFSDRQGDFAIYKLDHYGHRGI